MHGSHLKRSASDRGMLKGAHGEAARIALSIVVPTAETLWSIFSFPLLATTCRQSSET